MYYAVGTVFSLLSKSILHEKGGHLNFWSKGITKSLDESI